MTDRRQAILRAIMNDAWSRRRADVCSTFASCLRSAWAFSKRMDKVCRKIMRSAKAGSYVAFSPDLTRSPIRRTLRGKRYAGQKAYQAACATACFGN